MAAVEEREVLLGADGGPAGLGAYDDDYHDDASALSEGENGLNDLGDRSDG